MDRKPVLQTVRVAWASPGPPAPVGGPSAALPRVVTRRRDRIAFQNRHARREGILLSARWRGRQQGDCVYCPVLHGWPALHGVRRRKGRDG